MARRIKRPKVVWLPSDLDNRLGQAEDTAASDGHESSIGIFGVDVPGFDGTFATISSATLVTPVVKDSPIGLGVQEATLSDIEGSAYRLRRIVGKIYVECFQVEPAVGEPTDFIASAGFIILRTDDLGRPMNANNDTYNVNSLDSQGDPWIWRRSWRVANNTARPNSALAISAPSNHAYYGGGVLDGPHVDAKTARIVSNEERLFLVLTVIPLDGNENDQNDARVLFLTDLRVLASMRTQAGNRRNASR